MTMRFLANTEDGDKDSDSEIEFGGEDTFEDFRPKKSRCDMNIHLFVRQM